MKEQDYTPYCLLPKHRQKALTKAFNRGDVIEVWIGRVAQWEEYNNFDKVVEGFYEGYTYRPRPEPTAEVTLTIDGKPASPCKLSKESWAALRERS